MRTVLLAGATGILGRHVARELTARGYRVRRLVRGNAGPEDWLGDLRWAPSLLGAVEGVDAVVSCAGASMRLDDWRDRFTFTEIDQAGNRNLIEAVQRSRARKFVYISLAGGRDLMHTEYAAAHERVVDTLAASGLRYTVVRPTGFFSFFRDAVRQGRGAVVGDGSSRTNPIHEADVARACVDALTSDRTDLPVGGPQIYTRRELARLTLDAMGDDDTTVRSIPAWAVKPLPALLRVVNPRIAALLEFGIAVSQIDVIAPAYGQRTLAGYFESPSPDRRTPAVIH